MDNKTMLFPGNKLTKVYLKLIKQIGKVDSQPSLLCHRCDYSTNQLPKELVQNRCSLY